MSFHDNLKQTFQNFKDTFIGSTDISSIGNGKITGAISTLNTGKQKTLIAGENITIAQDGTISASGGDWSSEIDSLETITSTHTSELSSLSTSMSEISTVADSLSTQTSNQTIQITSLTTENSNQTSNINSLSVAQSELSSETTIIASEVATKQDELIAGTGITIINNVISSSAAGVKLEIVQTLPVSDIDPQTIYLVPSSAPGTSNVYDEYIYVNNAWENIGSTSVDLTNYYTKTEVGSLFTSQSTAQSEVDSSQNVSISSLSTENASQTSQITSLSISASETASVVSSLSTTQSTQAETISSLSTDTSELGSEVTELSSEVADKQDILIAGTGIEINEYNVISATGGGAVLYWEEIYPTSSSESNTTSESESQSES